MRISEELEQRAHLIADPAVRWVNRNPLYPEEACTVIGPVTPFSGGPKLSRDAAMFVGEWLLDAEIEASYKPLLLADWNDQPGRQRHEVVDLLLEAADLARDMGL